MIKMTKIGMPCASKLHNIEHDDDHFCFQFELKAISLNRYIALHRMTRMKLRRLESLIISFNLCRSTPEGDRDLMRLHAIRNEILSPTQKNKDKAKKARKELKDKRSAILDVLKSKSQVVIPLCKPMPFAQALRDDGTQNAVAISFDHKRRRLLDIDNYVTKHLLDTFVRIGLLDSDDPNYLYSVEQSHWKAEKGDTSPDTITASVFSLDYLCV